QQSLNEQLATEIHKRQNTSVPFVHYETEKTSDDGVLSKCVAFTSEQTEFVSAFEVVSSEKGDHAQSVYDSYIQICARHGMDQAQMQDFMDYQTLTDFIISNSDEHLMNFGVLRDSHTMELVAPAPIFDSGNSMFYADERKIPYDRVSILERKITSFHDSEERMLSHVKNKTIVDSNCLPSPEEIQSFYAGHGLPEERASFIADSYKVKLALLNDFQSGKKISLYREKKIARR
ncbi:MAG: hypothetical protein IJU25_08720, partial [Lachnospiraceae bacterium]|nr:hypothetical protein [Lachnospiraceae bacterium]